MTNPLRRAAVAAFLGLIPATLIPLAVVPGALAVGVASPALAGEAGDLVFAARGPWALDGRTLTWALTREGPALPDFLQAHGGTLAMTQTTDPSDNKPVLQLTQTTDAGARKIGPFPISGSDPVVIFFLENTTRDMAMLTGGNPDYIRNRIKDAVFRGGSVLREKEQVVAEMQPFAADPNKDRMGGFGTLTLRFVMDADPKAPIRELSAATTGDVTVTVPREMAGQTIAPARYYHAMALK